MQSGNAQAHERRGHGSQRSKQANKQVKREFA